MKTAQDPRHKKRQERVQKLFSHSFQSKKTLKSIQPILDNLKIIDDFISQAAPEWPLDKINKVDLAVLRLATYEIFFDEDVPEKVSIDEAVEIAKKFGSESSPSFVNGVLGTILKKKKSKR